MVDFEACLERFAFFQCMDPKEMPPEDFEDKVSGVYHVSASLMLFFCCRIVNTARRSSLRASVWDLE